MRKLMKLGVSAVALVALAVAAIGAGSASATVLCSVNSSPCPSGSLIAGPSRSAAITATSTNTTIRTSGGILNPTVRCGSSSMAFTAGPGGGVRTSLPARLTGLTFTSCTSADPTDCGITLTVTDLPTSGSVAWTSDWNGTLTFTSPDVEIDCPLFGSTIRCHYGHNVVTATVSGGSPATITLTGVAWGSTSGSPCPPTATWSSTYVINSPRPLYPEDQ